MNRASRFHRTVIATAFVAGAATFGLAAGGMVSVGSELQAASTPAAPVVRTHDVTYETALPAAEACHERRHVVRGHLGPGRAF